MIRRVAGRRGVIVIPAFAVGRAQGIMLHIARLRQRDEIPAVPVYRAIVHVTIWSAQDVLMVPVAALFRKGEDWAVFAVKDGAARAIAIKIGQRNGRMAEVQRHHRRGPCRAASNRVKDGVTVSERDVR